MQETAVTSLHHIQKDETRQTRELSHKVISANDIVIPEIMFHPIKFGDDVANQVFSEPGGIIPSQCIFVTGEAGSGKTTLCAKLASTVISDKKPLFLSYEMSDYQLKLQSKKIKNFNEKLNIITECYSLESLILDIETINPSFVILDSVQKLAYKISKGRDKDQIDIVDAFTAFAKRTFIPVIFIGHSNKDGSYKGPTKMIHDVDTHVQVGIDHELMERHFHTKKNRFGGNATVIPFTIHSDNVYIGNSSKYTDITEVVKSEPKEEPNINLDNLQNKFKNELQSFLEKSKGEKTVSFANIKNVLDYGLKYLCVKHKDLMKEETICKTNEVTLKYKPVNRSYCVAGKSLINFSPKQYNRYTDGLGKGYKKEIPFTNKYCKGKKEAYAIWILFHEFTHLFQGMQNHKIEFFQKIEKFVQEDKWIFDLIEEKIQ